MNQKCLDAAVLGLGTMGTFACLEIARRKASVIGIDRFVTPHDRGSHSGDTRVYREAYSEHPDYVPLALRAGDLWDALGEQSGTSLLHRCGMIYMGLDSSQLISGVRGSAARHKICLENLLRSELKARFPAFAPPPDTVAVFERRAGWIDVNGSLTFGLKSASRLGADIRLDTTVQAWQKDGDGFRVMTSRGPVLAGRLVITAGAWAGDLLADLQIPLKVLRKVLVWVDPQQRELFIPERFPIFAYSDRFLYGFPNLGGKGVKLSIHHDQTARSADADIRQAAPAESEIKPVLAMSSALMPGLGGPKAVDRVLSARTCLYTMTPDEHFIIDHHPGFSNVVFAAGFSGHGFKFAPVIGEALAEMVLLGQATSPIGFLGLQNRFTKPQEVKAK